ncbi:hypothetical protein Pcinc_010652 [Petrolisthes cinctipes]|uniref:Dynein heavy chain domain-containing protein 1 n=1 Tax=Petrolisthes cinctipes TaxID=88211 RepID=A0AAE1G4B8_PETCI|nr:hypothetical protein Pcinc_010652 [Petrolisthes cinctipes]
MEVCPFKELMEVEEEICLKMMLWRSLSEWEDLTHQWYQSEVSELDVRKVRHVTGEYRGRVNHLMGASEEDQHSDVLFHLDSLVSLLEEKLPVLEALTDSALRPRHWQEIDASLSSSLPRALTLAHVDQLALHQHAHTLQQVAHTAQLQREMENRLKQIEERWEEATIPIKDYTRKDMYVLGDLSHLDTLLLDTDLTLHLLLHSQHGLHIKTDTIKWKNTHTIIKHTLDSLRELEEEWLALDPVLTTCVAQETFPLQATTFATTSIFWTHIITKIKDEPHIVRQIRGGLLREELVQARSQLEGLRSCLAPLLALRRQTCPRLFLLPDRDLLHLLTRGEESEVCHAYLTRLFPGVARLIHGSEDRIVALVSPQQETLTLAKPVLAHHGVEDWLGRVESCMRASLRRLILGRHLNTPLNLYSSILPYQVLEVSRRIHWCQQVEEALDSVSSTLSRPDLSIVASDIRRELQAVTEALRNGSNSDSMQNEQRQEAESVQDYREKEQQCKGKMWSTRLVHGESDVSKGGNNILMRKKDNWKEKSEENTGDKKKNDTGSQHTKHNDKYLKVESLSCLMTTLLELRDTTEALHNDSPSSKFCYEWIQHLRHRVVGSGRTAGVEVAAGVENVDYGYEYVGVTAPSTLTPATLRARHALLTAAATHRCGVAVGAVGEGKTETLRGLSRAAGQHLASLTCSAHTPAQTLYSVISGGVQGGFWLLFDEAALLPPALLQRLAQCLQNIRYTKLNALRRCLIDGQEMKLVDSFSLFLTVTSPPDPTAAPHCPLLAHPLSPHLTTITVSLPRTETLLEVVLRGRGFLVSSAYLHRIHKCLVHVAELGGALPSLVRLVQAAGRVGSSIRNSVRGKFNTDSNEIHHLTRRSVLKGTQIIPNGESNGGSSGDSVGNDQDLKESHSKSSVVPEFGGIAEGEISYTKPTWKSDQSSNLKSFGGQSVPSLVLTDEDIITRAMYVVLTPLVNDVQRWNMFFRKNFNNEELQNGQYASDDMEIKKSICEVLLEWGYGDDDDEEEEEEEEAGGQVLGTNQTLNQLESCTYLEGTVMDGTLEDQKTKENNQLADEVKSNQSLQQISNGGRKSNIETSEKGETTSTQQNVSNVDNRSKEDEVEGGDTTTGNGDKLLGESDNNMGGNQSKFDVVEAGVISAYNINGYGKVKQGKSNRKKKLTPDGKSLLVAALHLHSLLYVHHCCCLSGSSGAGKSTVWKALCEALNRVYKGAGKEPKEFVKYRVVPCGALTRGHLLGTWRDGGTVWQHGVIFNSLIQAQQEECVGAYWLVLVGPFLPNTLSVLASLCHPTQPFTDEALHHVSLGEGQGRVILEMCPEEHLDPKVLTRCPVVEVGIGKMTEKMAAGGATKALANVLPCLRSRQSLARVTSTLVDGLHTLHLPHTSLECLARCACQLTEGRVTPSAGLEEVLEAMAVVIDLLHTARYPHLHQDAREGSYTPARLDSRSPAPSDAFLDYPGRVVATPEFQAGLSLLPQLLDASCPILLHSRPGHGLSTFLDVFERHKAPATQVIRFRCTPLSTSQDLFSCITASLFIYPLRSRHTNPVKCPQQSHGGPLSSEESVEEEKDEAPTTDQYPEDNVQRSQGVVGLEAAGDLSCEVQVLAPGDKGFYLLILEDVHLQLNVDGAVGSILETFRHLVECGEVVCPVSGKRYHVERVLPLLALNCTAAIPDHLVPTRVLRHCIPMALPHTSPATCQYIIKVCLQEALVEIDEDNHLPMATREAILSLYQELQDHSTTTTTTTTTQGEVKKTNKESDTKRTSCTDTVTAAADAQEESAKYPESHKICHNSSSGGKQENKKQTCVVGHINKSKNDASSRDEDGWGVANLHHLLQLIEAIRRDTCYLQLTMGQAASLITFEASRIFSNLAPNEIALRQKILPIIENHFEEIEERLTWWPGVTKDGKKTMTHARDYNEFLRTIQYPEGLAPIMFSVTLHETMLKLVLTLETPGGHILLQGPPGVGKMSLARLAAHNTRARVYRLDEHREEADKLMAVRAAVQMAGVGGRRTLLLLRQHVVSPVLLDILHSLANYGWTEGLWEDGRVRGLLEAVRQRSSKSPRPQDNRWVTHLEEDEVSEGWWCRYPSLRGRWVWVRMTAWAVETLMEVARRALLPIELPPPVLHQLQAALPAIHQVVCEEEGVEGTAGDYVEMCRVTVKLLTRRRTQLKDSLSLFKGGMDKLQETSGNVEELKSELGELEPELKATQEEGQRLTHALAHHRSQVSTVRDQMLAQEDKVKERSDAVTALGEDISQEVGEALPGLEAAEKSIRALDKKDLVEVRVLNKPPDIVLLVLEPICILLSVKPEWSAIKTLLGDPTMTKRMLEVEKDTISDTTLRKLKKYTESPKFVPDEVGKVSKPCRPLCSWLKALEHYAQVVRNVEPKKMKLAEAERELTTAQLEQRQFQQQLGQCERELSELQARYEGCVCRRQQLEGGIKRATARLQRCTRLTTVLADEDSRWSAKIKVLVKEVESVYGECVLGGVSVAYLAALPTPRRDTILRRVVSVLRATAIVTPKQYDLVETLSTGEFREAWEAADLYSDPTCLLQAALVTTAVRTPLVFDPDQMCVRWLTRLYEERGGLAVLQAGDEALPSRALAAAQARRPILVLNTPTYLTHNLRKLLDIPFLVMGGEGERPDVLLVLVTGSAAPQLPIELSVHFTRVSFALPPLVLEERLLNDVLKMEREDLFEQRANLTASLKRDHKALTAVDDNILQKLTQASTALLDNEELLAAFYEAKATSSEFRTRLAESKRTLHKIGNVRDKYRPVATRARLLFSTSTALRRLDPNYVFSFRHFLHLFSACISGGDRTEALSFDQRIESLVRSVTQLVVTHVSRALCPSHRLAFTSALCAAIAADEDTLKADTWHLILDPSYVDQAKVLRAAVAREAELETIVTDLLKGTRLHLVLHDLVTDVGLSGSKGPVEAPRGRISDFNALMLLRLTKPRMVSSQGRPVLVAGAREVVNSMLGDPSLLWPDLSLSRMLGVEERKLPVLVWTDHGRDVAGEVLAAANTRGVAGNTRVIMAPAPSQRGGEVECCGTGLVLEAGSPTLSTVLANAVQQGGWVVVQGAESRVVLPTLLEAMTSLDSPDIKVHDDFRLVVTVGLGRAAPSDLTLLARPLYATPSPTLPSTLTAAAALMDSYYYRHHYLGSAWRRAVWQVAAVHTIITVTRQWCSYTSTITTQITPPLRHPGTPDTHITTVNHIASQPTSPSPTQPTHSPDTHTTTIQPTSSIPRRPPSSSTPPNPPTKTQGGLGEESKVEEERDDLGEEQMADEMGKKWEEVRRGESGKEKEVKEPNEGELKEKFGKYTESDKDEPLQDTCTHPVDKTVKKSARSLTAVGGMKDSSLEGHTSLQHLSLTYNCLAKLSLERVLDDSTVTTFLSAVYGRREVWQGVVACLPREVGRVSREAALSIVTSHLTTSLSALHNITLDVEYRGFQQDLNSIAQDIFPNSTTSAEE